MRPLCLSLWLHLSPRPQTSLRQVGPGDGENTNSESIHRIARGQFVTRLTIHLLETPSFFVLFLGLSFSLLPFLTRSLAPASALSPPPFPVFLLVLSCHCFRLRLHIVTSFLRLINCFFWFCPYHSSLMLPALIKASLCSRASPRSCVISPTYPQRERRS